MMPIRNITGFLLLLLIAGSSFTSCKKLKFDEPPHNCGVPAPWEANTTIQDLKDSYIGVPLQEITKDWFIEGVVQSSDQEGNFFKQLYIHDGTAGMEVRVDIVTMYNLWPVGQKVVIDCKGLFLGNYGGQVQIGYPFQDGSALSLGRIPQVMAEKRIAADSCKGKPAKPMLKLGDVNNDNVNQLVTLEDVFFADNELGKTYADAINRTTQNRTLTNAAGDRILLRTSGFAAFAGQPLPQGKGTITGVLTKFNADFQLMINRLEDVKLDSAFNRGGDTSWIVNKTIADLKLEYNNSGTFEQITQDWILEATVTANDASGNLFKEIYVQDNTGGIQININAYDLHSEFAVGQKVKVNTKGMYLNNVNGEIQLGSTYIGTGGQTLFGGIQPADVPKHIAKITGGVPLQPTLTTIDAITDNMIGMLVQLDNVQFAQSALGETYASPSNQQARNRTLEDCDTNTIIVRTSGYASFAGTQLPQDNGTLVAILSKFNADYQLFIRQANEVNFTQARCGGGGGTILLNETFQGITPGSGTTVVPINLPGWVNVATTGTDVWEGREFSGDKFAQFASFYSNNAANQSWLITPGLQTSGLSSVILTFKSAVAFYTHDAMEVLVSTNFNGTPGGIASATWTVLSPTLAGSGTPNYNWIPSGNVDLSSFNGTIHIAFVYTGSKPANQTGTYRLNDIKVVGQ